MPILKVDQKNLKTIVKIMVKSIKQGEVVVCPTDTVYGLLADATNKKAVKKLLKIKKRKAQTPIPIFVKDLKEARKIAKIDKKEEKFLKKVWPGKVTAILRPKRKFPKGIGKPKKEIGLRIPNYKIINQLLKLCNHPLTGTSANISGKPPSTKIKEVLKQFKNQKYQPDLIIDAGNLPKSKPSVVLDLRIWPPKILRL
ncbi:MAG: threonylcarbamoyl-AMP synthase [Candidatus Nealsonbacteria bacterium]|nr:MAG: threonylcarbamoyl-AMP synthase [Candidatus Nealsonbacteria bacterium]